MNLRSSRIDGTGVFLCAGIITVSLGDPMETLTTIIYWLIPTTIYFGPSIIAVCRHHYRARYIILANLLFGWTIVGLFVTFAWSLSSTRRTNNASIDSPPTDFGERLFHNRNIIHQPDGGANKKARS